MTFLAPELVQLGYTGVTGTTPHTTSTAAQVQTLQSQSVNALTGQTIARTSIGVIHLNVNFEGTQNNRDYVAAGESQTNIASLQTLQANATGVRNSFYYTGVGAQTVPTGTLLPNGNLDPQSSTRLFESTPGLAGDKGNAIIVRAYDEITDRIAAIRTNDPNAQIAINLAGFSRGGAEAVAFANLLNERGIPGLYAPGQVPVNTLTLFDPVAQVNGQLNVTWPTNLVNPALVFVATGENRIFFAAMPVGAGIIVPIAGVHSDIGGSFNPDGISAVTLKPKDHCYQCRVHRRRCLSPHIWVHLKAAIVATGTMLVQTGDRPNQPDYSDIRSWRMSIRH